MTTYSYACCEFPGMEDCPGKVEAGTEPELWQLIEAHARIAHEENVSDWSDDDREQVRILIRTNEDPPAKTFLQLAAEAMNQARAISPAETLAEMASNPEVLLVDVRDESEVLATGLAVGAINAPGRSLAWKADLEFDEQYRDAELQDRSRRIITTCGSSPCYRGASAANLLAEMGFNNVAYVDGGMAALLAAGIETR